MYWIALAFAPAIALVWFFYAGQVYRPQGRMRIALLFWVGGCSALLALGLNHMVEKHTQLWPYAPQMAHRILFWFFGVGLNEEFVKLLALLLVLYPRRDFTTSYQGLLGGATVALGFAAVENLFYLERYGGVTLLWRSLLTVPAHACFTIPQGMSLARSKVAVGFGAKYGWLLGGLATSAFLHGLYDVWLSFAHPLLHWLAYAQVGVMTLLVLYTMRALSAHARRTLRDEGGLG